LAFISSIMAPVKVNAMSQARVASARYRRIRVDADVFETGSL